MFTNYVKVAWRNFMRSKAYSFINIVGLATGMAVALMIGLWIWDETSFDHYHHNHSQLAQVMDSQTNDGETTTSMEVVVPLAEELRTKYAAAFNKVALTSWNFGHILSAGETKIAQPGIFAQPDLPEMNPETKNTSTDDAHLAIRPQYQLAGKLPPLRFERPQPPFNDYIVRCRVVDALFLGGSSHGGVTNVAAVEPAFAKKRVERL